MALLSESSPYRELLSSFFHTFSNELQMWIDANFQTNLSHPDHLIHKTLSNHMVRSKSEVIIANSLFTHKIPYRYECALDLDDLIFYPDFTILHPSTKKIFYWEHFGMMDNCTYRENAFHKLQIYGEHDIIPTINLLTTFETQKHPLDSSQVDFLIERYFG